jgi:phosphatidylglycerol:prolipoprotein diacylglycerol transferase
MNFLHSFSPNPIAVTFGPLSIYWYGIVLALAMSCALALAVKIGKHKNISSETIFDLAIWLIIGGLIGARMYEIGLNFSYYINAPIEIFQLWNGGLAIHGGLIGGVIALIIYIKKKKLDFWKLAAVLTPAVALGQAIGRWGNWFNQELFGVPTSKPWGIPIEALYRPEGYHKFLYFHPTFLYESIGSLVICIFLIFLLRHHIKNQIIVGSYFILYGILRFALEFIKIDPTPLIFNIRWPQIMSIILVIIGVSLIVSPRFSVPQKDS